MIDLLFAVLGLLIFASCIVGVIWFCVFKVLDLWLGPPHVTGKPPQMAALAGRMKDVRDDTRKAKDDS